MSEEQNKKVLGALISTIRNASKLAAQDISFYKSLDKSLERSSDNTSGSLLDLVNRLVSTVSPGEVETLNETQDIDTHWKDLSNVIDTLFEKTDIALDSLKKGKNNKVNSSNESGIEVGSNANDSLKRVEGASSDKVIRHSKTLAKPQLEFKTQVDNSKNVPFRPLLTSKPWAIVPFEESIKFVEHDEDEEIEHQENDTDLEASSFSSSASRYLQPYAKEIAEQPYPDMIKQDPIPSTDWDTTQEIYVDTIEKLQDMLQDLKSSTEIAVDLEHHDYRSYFGIVCLMQISNREKDWIVDTLVLRDELQILNEVFADPKIIKVLHGAYMDIMWLQRDLGLYIVSLFDTFSASKALGFPKHGLAYLLETYAKFVTSKKYQLADWRIRPLPALMQSYARSDTHFLLNIFDQLRNRLIDNDRLHVVLEESRSIAGQRYEHPGYGMTTSEQCESILIKYRLSRSQQVVLRDLYEWRDNAARKADESPRFIVPNHFLVALSVSQPTNVAGVLSVSNGATAYVRASSVELAKLIERAKDKVEEQEEDVEEVTTADNTVVIDTTIVEDYEDYLSKFEAAVEWQRKFFSVPKIGSAVDSLRITKSKLFSCVITTTPSLSPEIYTQRAELVRDKLNLYVPVPPTDEDGEEEEEEREDDAVIIDDDHIGPKIVEPSVEISEESGDIFESSDSAKRRADELDEDEDRPLASKKSKRSKRRKLKVLDQKEVEGDEKLDGTAGYEEDKNENSQPFPDVPFNAFDFKSAPTVLKKPEVVDKRRQKKDRKKDSKQESNGSFNPYGNVSDSTPKGARKISRPTGGHTYTFKKKR